MTFRDDISKDKGFLVAKQKVMAPIFDFASLDQFKLSSNSKDNWFTQIVSKGV